MRQFLVVNQKRIITIGLHLLEGLIQFPLGETGKILIRLSSIANSASSNVNPLFQPQIYTDKHG